MFKKSLKQCSFLRKIFSNNNNNNNNNNAGDVERREKANKGCFLASLGNLLLPGANDEISFNIINSCANL